MSSSRLGSAAANRSAPQSQGPPAPAPPPPPACAQGANVRRLEASGGSRERSHRNPDRERRRSPRVSGPLPARQPRSTHCSARQRGIAAEDNPEADPILRRRRRRRRRRAGRTSPLHPQHLPPLPRPLGVEARGGGVMWGREFEGRGLVGWGLREAGLMGLWAESNADCRSGRLLMDCRKKGRLRAPSLAGKGKYSRALIGSGTIAPPPHPRPAVFALGFSGPGGCRMRCSREAGILGRKLQMFPAPDTSSPEPLPSCGFYETFC